MSRRRHAASTLLRAAANFRSDKALDLSATVAFWALLALAPLLVLVGAGVGALGRQSSVLPEVLDRLAPFLPREVGESVRTVGGELAESEGLVFVAVPSLLWVVTSAFSAFEFAVNVAFGTAPRRRFWRSRLGALAALAVTTVLLAASLTTATLLARVEPLAQRLGLVPPPGQLLRLGSWAGVLLLAYGCFLFLFRTLPRGGVRWDAASRGALVAVLLWEAARRLFSWTLARSPAFGILSGSVAAMVSILLWIFTAVAVSLYGAEVAAVLNGSRDRDELPAP